MAADTTKSAEKTKTTQATWPDFLASMYDMLTGRGSEITYNFDNFNLYIPAKLGEQSDHFHWKFDGTLNISTTNKQEKDE